MHLKLRCDERFTHAFTACGCVSKVITLVWANQGNVFENATACSKRTLKTIVATQLKTLLYDKDAQNVGDIDIDTWMLWYDLPWFFQNHVWLTSVCFSILFPHMIFKSNMEVVKAKYCTVNHRRSMTTCTNKESVVLRSAFWCKAQHYIIWIFFSKMIEVTAKRILN